MPDINKAIFDSEVNSRCCMGEDVISDGAPTQCNNGDCHYIKPTFSGHIAPNYLHVMTLGIVAAASGRHLMRLLRPPIA